MFNEDYKNQIEKIKPDGYIKDKIKRRMRSGSKARTSRGAVIFRGASAAVLCLAVLCSSIVFINRSGEPAPNPSSAAVKPVQSYDSIFSKMESFRPSMWDKVSGIFNGGSKGSVNEDAALYASQETATGAAGAPGSAKPGSTSADGLSAKDDHSETTTQVEGVDEADTVKTDGRYIYSLSSGGHNIRIIDTAKGLRKLAAVTVEDGTVSEFYLHENRLVLIGMPDPEATGKNGTAADCRNVQSDSFAELYDISDPASPQKLIRVTQSGAYNTSRLIGGKLYLLTNHTVNTDEAVKNKPETFVPYIECRGHSGAVKAESIVVYDECRSPEYTVICGYDISDGSLTGTQSVLGGSYTVYASTQNIITAGYAQNGETELARYAINNGKVTLEASGKIKGSLLNQFSIDEYKNHFRFVTTSDTVTETTSTPSDASAPGGSAVISATVETSSSLIILDKSLKQTGAIVNIAPGERVYSVRFMGDVAYFVTFRQVDPLFSVDVSRPASPKIIGSLKIPGFSNYLFPYGDGRLLGIGQDADENTGRTTGVKLSMFDISNPANVTESAKTPAGVHYSPSLYNHKSTLADSGKNLIGFYGEDHSGGKYLIYSFENGRFVKKADVALGNGAYDARGLYIGDTFYIVYNSRIISLDMNGFTIKEKLEL